MIDRVLKGVDKYDVSVVLLHDTNALDVTVEMLPELIEEQPFLHQGKVL